MRRVVKIPISCLFLLSSLLLSACAYQWGAPRRQLPGGAHEVAIPIFENETQEVGVEVPFTSALRQEFYKSRKAQIVERENAEVLLHGRIQRIQYLPGGKKTSGDPGAPFLPSGTVLAAEYRIILVVSLRALNAKTGDVLWEGDFSGEKTYVAPQVTLAEVNTINPLYNLSARRQNIESMATEMMSEAYSSITENF